MLPTQKSINILKTILVMQDSLNAKIDPNWIETKNPFLRAAWIELSEAANHLGWVWWKKTTPNNEAVNLEFIDVIHFAASEFIIRYGKADSTSNTDILASILSRVESTRHEFNENILESIEDLVGLCCKRVWDDKIFVLILQLCNASGLSLDNVLELYLVKNTLNAFRKANGYKEGTYLKMWFGKEDNDSALDLMKQLSKEGFMQEVSTNIKALDRFTELLQIKYNEVKQLSTGNSTEGYM